MACLWLMCVALVVTGCGTLSNRIITDPTPSVTRLESGGSLRAEVDALVQPLIDSGEVFSMAVGVVTYDGAARVYGYGRPGRSDDPPPPQGESVFQIGSVSKLFVGALLARLIEERQVRWEDTVRDLLPAGVELSPDAASLTLYDLITNTGSLPRQPNNPLQAWYFLTFEMTGRNLYGCIDRPYLYDYLRTLKLPPRSERQYGYSNIGLALLSHLIEVRTGRPITELMEEKVTGPLGLRDTVMRLRPDQERRLVMGHVGDEPRLVPRHTPMAPWDMGEIMHPTCGMFSTVNDLMVFAKANLGLPSHGLTPLLQSQHQAHARGPEGSVGLGWMLDSFASSSLNTPHKHGMTSGYTAYIGLNTERKLAVVVLCSNFNWNEKVGHNLLLRLSSARLQLPPATLASW